MNFTMFSNLEVYIEKIKVRQRQPAPYVDALQRNILKHQTEIGSNPDYWYQFHFYTMIRIEIKVFPSLFFDRPYKGSTKVYKWRFTVDSKIILTLAIFRAEKLIPNAVL